MPPRPLTPSYCLDNQRGRNLAFVRINGRKRYLGPHGSEESYRKYRQVLAEWFRGPDSPLPAETAQDAGESIHVETLIAAWVKHGRAYYNVPDTGDGKRPNGELGNYWDVLRELRHLYSGTRAIDFGPKALKNLAMSLAIDRPYTDLAGRPVLRRAMCRNVINRHLARIKSVFRWAVSEELLPGEVLHRLEAVRGLPAGRGQARESDPVKPVSDADVEAVSRSSRAMSRVWSRCSVSRGCDRASCARCVAATLTPPARSGCTSRPRTRPRTGANRA